MQSYFKFYDLEMNLQVQLELMKEKSKNVKEWKYLDSLWKLTK